ncbi:MAG: PrsW family intramembrane metalloprotease [Candidatus Limnocylindrales bacterium]
MTAAIPALNTPPTLPPPPYTSPGRRAPRWGIQMGLFQPRQFAFYLFLVSIILGAIYGLLVQLVEASISPVGWTLSWLLMLLYIVPVALLIRWIDLYEREPRSMVLGAFMWGALVVPLFGGFGNDLWGVFIAKAFGGEFASQWSAALTAPVIEEIYKYLGIVVLYLIARLEVDDLIDGFVYGALIGLGFAVAEDIFYFMFHFGGSVAAVIEGFFVRVIASGLYGHVTFTGIAGIGFAYFVSRRADKPFSRRFAVAAGLLLLAMLAHFIWNSPLFNDLPILLYGVVKGAPFLIGLIVLLYLARRRENVALTEVLTPELSHGGVLGTELALLRDRKARREGAHRVGAAGGPLAEQAWKQLQREQVKLALVSSAVDSADDARAIQQRGVVQGMRARLLQFPNVAAALDLTPEAAAVLMQTGALYAAPFAASKVVAPSGAWAWTTPNQHDPRRLVLAARLPLQVMETRDDWLLVRSQSGWYGWTGAPYLVDTRIAANR